ncbi:MAG: cupin domain-containing protein [Actinomycetota bacterium]
MAESAKASFDSPDEVRTFDKGKVEIVNLGSQKVGRSVFQPGWKWSECVKPIVGGDSCQVHHVGYIVSGTIHIVMNDGNEFDGGPGEVYEILPGHDAWVVGDDEFVGLEFQRQAVEEYAKA